VIRPSSKDLRLAWPLWAAAALAVVGGVLPFLLGGSASRLDGVIVPFWAGAIALGLCAWLHKQGRAVTSTLYFVGGLAIVFGLLSMFSLPVRLAALGACPAPPASCNSGLPLPLSDAEINGMGAASAVGIVAILLGYYGLAMLYRRTAVAPVSPPVRKIPPIAPPRAAAVEEPELPAHDEEELPELPAHESSTSST
jgi:hypothetical protein